MQDTFIPAGGPNLPEDTGTRTSFIDQQGPLELDLERVAQTQRVPHAEHQELPTSRPFAPPPGDEAPTIPSAPHGRRGPPHGQPPPPRPGAPRTGEFNIPPRTGEFSVLEHQQPGASPMHFPASATGEFNAGPAPPLAPHDMEDDDNIDMSTALLVCLIAGFGAVAVLVLLQLLF